MGGSKHGFWVQENGANRVGDLPGLSAIFNHRQPSQGTWKTRKWKPFIFHFDHCPFFFFFHLSLQWQFVSEWRVHFGSFNGLKFSWQDCRPMWGLLPVRLWGMDPKIRFEQHWQVWVLLKIELWSVKIDCCKCRNSRVTKIIVTLLHKKISKLPLWKIFNTVSMDTFANPDT